MTSAEGAGPSAPPPRFAALILCAAALAAMLPELWTGLSLSDSFRYNLVWTEQFTALVRAGHLYPRWLPSSWDGLGSPTFYFYPPFYFWVSSAVDALTFHTLRVDALVSLASAVMLAASGLSMRAWLRLHVAPGPAFLGALAFMAAPYHLYDIYVRGALAESCAYAFLPLLAIALRRLADGRRGAFFLFAGAYAVLILSHLPSTLLASLFLVAPYALFCGRRYAAAPVRYLLIVAAAGAIGVALAACYLLPAILLVPYISLDAFVGPYFRPETWFFWRPGAWPQPEAMWLIIPFALAGLLLVGGAALARRGRGPAPEAWLWSGVVVAAIVMVSGLLPFLWKLPLLAQVQFPWRLYVLVEFAAITAIAASLPLRWNPPLAAATMLLYLCLGFTALLVSARFNAFASRHAAEAASVRKDYREAPEYLPRGLPIPAGVSGAPDPALLLLPPGPEAEADVPGATLRTARAADGGLRVEVDSPAAATIVARRFYFPHWRVTDGAGREVPAAPSESARRLAWRAPAGRSAFVVRNGSTEPGRLGLEVSAAALLLLLALGAWLGIAGRDKPQKAR
jgi:hypothetical protein